MGGGWGGEVYIYTFRSTHTVNLSNVSRFAPPIKELKWKDEEDNIEDDDDAWDVGDEHHHDDDDAFPYSETPSEKE